MTVLHRTVSGGPRTFLPRDFHVCPPSLHRTVPGISAARFCHCDVQSRSATSTSYPGSIRYDQTKRENGTHGSGTNRQSSPESHYHRSTTNACADFPSTNALEVKSRRGSDAARHQTPALGERIPNLLDANCRPCLRHLVTAIARLRDSRERRCRRGALLQTLLAARFDWCRCDAWRCPTEKRCHTFDPPRAGSVSVPGLRE